jgi:hypothetical protein
MGSADQDMSTRGSGMTRLVVPGRAAEGAKKVAGPANRLYLADETPTLLVMHLARGRHATFLPGPSKPLSDAFMVARAFHAFGNPA